MKPTGIARLAAALALLITLSACSGPNLFVENEKRLGADFDKIEAGDLAGASRDLESMLASTEGKADELKVQRYYAACLLMKTHSRASLGSPFIKDTPRGTSSGIGSEAGASGSETAHIVATMMWANVAKELAVKAKGGKLREGNVELLPSGLRGLSPQDAEAGVDFVIALVYARLGFDDRVAKTLDASTALHKLENCESLMEKSRVDPRMRPWVYHTMFQYLRTRDEPAAYKFGVRLLETAEASGGTLGKAETDAVVTWIRSGSKFAFRCPSCNQPVVPELRACQNDQTPHLSFYAEPKQP